ncbi:uncharacterized protein LOC118200006 [Stegodyphus dumicola]|uniref:uncharacterized protein LOC118200006 n=1 Tax=Stegodyphus dumicola TaxID=202533 RepID=UPI0015ACDE8C|nr:uncharacterized protein LOC118200006 [Stegodyphus dumicola]
MPHKLCLFLLSIIPGCSKWSLIRDCTRVFIFYVSLITLIVFTTTLLCVDSELWKVVSITNVCFFSLVLLALLSEGLRLYISDRKKKSKNRKLVTDATKRGLISRSGLESVVDYSNLDDRKKKSKNLELVTDTTKQGLIRRNSLESIIDYSNLNELEEPSCSTSSPVPNIDLNTVYENWPYYFLAKKMVTKYGVLKGVWKDGAFKGKLKKKPKKRRVCAEYVKTPDKHLKTKTDSSLPYMYEAPEYKGESTESAIEIDDYSSEAICIELSSDSGSDMDKNESVQPEGDIFFEDFVEDDKYKGDKGKMSTSSKFLYKKRAHADTGPSSRDQDADAGASGENCTEVKPGADPRKESNPSEDDLDTSSVKQQNPEKL